MMRDYPESLVLKDNILEMLDIAIASPPGIWVEVGVYKGGTAYRLYLLKGDRDLYLYDTFEGIPEWTKGLDDHEPGAFGDVEYEKIKTIMPDAKIFKGIFPDTLVKPLPPVAFAHIDCDNYQSIRACIEHLSPFMVTGGTMYFDDYSSLKGATQAVDEMAPQREVLKNRKAIVRF